MGRRVGKISKTNSQRRGGGEGGKVWKKVKFLIAMGRVGF